MCSLRTSRTALHRKWAAGWQVRARVPAARAVGVLFLPTVGVVFPQICSQRIVGDGIREDHDTLEI